MSHYRSDLEELYVFDKKLKQEGTLRLSTEITIRGNPKRGPVPVTLEFVACFEASEKYQEIDAEDGEINWVRYEQRFDEKNDRISYINNFFEKI